MNIPWRDYISAIKLHDFKRSYMNAKNFDQSDDTSLFEEYPFMSIETHEESTAPNGNGHVTSTPYRSSTIARANKRFFITAHEFFDLENIVTMVRFDNQSVDIILRNGRLRFNVFPRFVELMDAITEYRMGR